MDNLYLLFWGNNSFKLFRILYKSNSNCAKIMFRQTLAFHNPPMVRLRLLLLLNIFPKWQEAGWLIVLIYLYIPSAEFSAFRVQQRFEQGGHNIPANDIVSRYPKSIKNLFLYSEVCDYTFCFNNKLGDVRPVWEKRKISR